MIVAADFTFVDESYDSIVGRMESELSQMLQWKVKPWKFSEFTIWVEFLRCDGIPARVQQSTDIKGVTVEWCAYLLEGMAQSADGSWNASYVVRPWDGGGW